MRDGQSHHGGLSFHQLAFHLHRQQQEQEQEQEQQQRAQPHSRVGRLRGTGGEIVEVQGGHIVRSTGRKDRHSKVCTAKGPRDRRVRLAAHTAIQFYDVQDRLGYDRPSKAVDWLIKNAKAAIDQLAELPPWTPAAAAAATSASGATPPAGHSPAAEQPSEESSKKQMLVDEPAVTANFSFDGSDGSGGDGSGGNSFLSPSLDNNAIADTIKSFFPIAAAANSTSPSSSPPPVGYQSYPPPLLSRTGSLTQDLRLSLQSFQDPIFHHSQPSHNHHHHYQHHENQNTTPSAHNSLLASSARLTFDAASACWAEQNRQMASWSMAEPNSGGGLGEFSFAIPPPQPVPVGPSQFFSQRGPLQSSNSPSVRGWAEPDAELQMQPVLHPSLSPIGYASEAGFSGFCIPARIQGVEEHGSISNKLPSASSASRH